MNEKTENKLFEKYPKLFPEGRKVNPKHSLMCFGFECEDGWYWLIDKLCDRIQSYIDANNKKQVVVKQVKEKFGGLRFYCRNLDILINGMIWFAESLSYSICEECGELGGELNEKGYTQTLCLKCRGKRK